MKNILERALKLLFFFYDLLIKVNCFGIHHRNLQKLAVEILKVKINIAPEVVEAVQNPIRLH